MSAKAKMKEIVYCEKGGELVPVIVMAKSGKWNLVRRPGCIPFVLHQSDIRELREDK